MRPKQPMSQRVAIPGVRRVVGRLDKATSLAGVVRLAADAWDCNAACGDLFRGSFDIETVSIAGMSSDALRILNTVFGYPAFRGEQGRIVEHVAGGGACLVLMPTGSGKSLCYQILALIRDGTAIVVSPLVAPMHDQ